jgi:hypothetical protein
MKSKRFELNQLIEVDDDKNIRIVSTSIKELEGENDLLSQAIKYLEDMGFNNKFQSRKSSRYVGFRSIKGQKGNKRYQIILAEKQDGIYISMPQDFLEDYVLNFAYWIDDVEFEIFYEELGDYFISHEFGQRNVGKICVLPSRKELFINNLSPQYWDLIENTYNNVVSPQDWELIEGEAKEERKGFIFLNQYEYKYPLPEDSYEPSVKPNSEVISQKEFDINTISSEDSYLIFEEDKQFPYAWKTFISSREVLKDFIEYFGKILMRAN